MSDSLREMISHSDNIVFLGGAGVSTESGIPDFRSAHGLYARKNPVPYEVMLSHTYFVRHPTEFYAFYKNVLLHPDAKPNAAHFALARLEAAGKLKAVITQNIDGLHQAAGSKNVIELHGSVREYSCMDCGKKYAPDFVLAADGVPRCGCGGLVRPDVVLYEEGLDENRLERAAALIERAGLLIVGGTSLTVYPAAGLVRCLGAGCLVILNRDPTPYDPFADLIVRESIGKALAAAVD